MKAAIILLCLSATALGNNFFEQFTSRSLDQQIKKMQESVNKISDYIEKKAKGILHLEPEAPSHDWFACESCKATVSTVDYLAQQKWVATPVEDLIVGFCESFHMMAPASCDGFIRNNAPLVIHSLLGFNLKPEFFCEEVWEQCDREHYKILDPKLYIDRVLKDKPDVIKNDDYVQNLYDSIKASDAPRKTFRMLHMTDAHFDLLYKDGALTDCDWVICCRAQNGFPSDPKKQAKPWGSFNCDLPYKTIDAMGDFINAEVKPDVVVFTGDTPPHDQWNYTLPEIKEYVAKFSNFMKTKLSAYTIFPIMGNHDFEEINSEDFHKPDVMLEYMLEHWKPYLEEGSQKTFAKAGYYA